MNPIMEIFSQGEEIVTGQIVDTNSAWLSQAAVEMGFNVARHSAVGDKLDDLIQLLTEIAQRADCCICTGGLGPTTDDLTAEAVALAFGLPLEFDERAFEQIRQFFQMRKRQMSESNRKQAMLPSGSVRIDNPVGTAPGFALQHGRCWFAFVPGVPTEMRRLFLDFIRPELLRRYTLNPAKLVTLKTIGIGESDLQDLIRPIALPPSVQVGYRAEIGQVQVKLLFPGDTRQQEIDKMSTEVAAVLGDTVYAIEGFDEPVIAFTAVIDQLMKQNQFTLAAVETLSQGLVAAKLIGVDWLLSTAYEKSLQKLLSRLSITRADRELAQLSKEIAQAIQLESGASIVSVQLIAESDPASVSSDGQTVINTLLVPDACYQASRLIAGDATWRQERAALFSLDMLRRYLQGKAI